VPAFNTEGQDAYKWESPLATDNVPSFNTIDAQVSYKLVKAKTAIN